MGIREIQVAGYRSVRDIRLRLRPLNVLTGPNASGKSNLYNSVFLLAKAAAGGLAQAIADEGGMPSVLWAGARRTRSSNPARREPVRLKLGVKTDDFCYELTLGLPVPQRSAFDLDPEVKEERVWMEMARGRPVTFFERSLSGTWIRDRDSNRTSYSGELMQSESVLSQLREPHLYPELSALRGEMGRWRFYHQFRTDLDSPLRRPQTGVRTPVLGHDGRDLAAALQTVDEMGGGDALQSAVGDAFAGASLFIDCEGGFSVAMKVPGVLRPLTARELSDGTLRYLCLLAALMSPRPPAVLALNEPETSLHADLLEPLARLMVEASKRSQLWVVTHSARLAELVEQHSALPAIRLQLVNGETKISGQRLIEDDE